MSAFECLRHSTSPFSLSKRPDVQLSRAPVDLTFPLFSCEGRPVSRSEVIQVNRLIVRCAEDCVFYRDRHAWVAGFIEKNRGYRIESVVSRIPTGRGIFTSASQMVFRCLVVEGMLKCAKSSIRTT